MRKETPILNNILKYLENLALQDRPDPLETIVAFVTMDEFVEASGLVLDVLLTGNNIDFFTYFESIDTLRELVKLKDKDIKKYYSIVYYENALIGMVSRILNLDYVITLNPDNLEKSYFIKLRYQSEEDSDYK